VKRNNRDDSVFSRKIRAGNRRTYFIDVRPTRGKDYYITLTESTRKLNGERIERQRIFLYREDFNRFLEGLQDCINHVKDELLPNYDFEKFDRRQEEWEANQGGYEDNRGFHQNERTKKAESDSEDAPAPDDDDMSW